MILEHIVRVMAYEVGKCERVGRLELNCTSAQLDASSVESTDVIAITIRLPDENTKPATVVVDIDDFVDAINRLRLYGGSGVKAKGKDS